MSEHRQDFIVVVPFVSANEIIMIKQYDPKADSFHLELPTDQLKPSESQNEAVRRVLTEIGFEANEIRCIGKYKVHDASVHKGIIISAYGKIPIHSRNGPIKLTLQEIEQMLLKNEIKTASSMIALYRVLQSRASKTAD